MVLMLLRKPKDLILRQIFHAWSVVSLQAANLALDQMVQTLAAKQAKRSDPLRSTNKADLLETARKELCYMWAYTEKFTVLELRALLKRNRQTVRQGIDPFETLPKGFGKMAQADLITELHLRDIVMPQPMNRASMILAIRDNVEQRRLLSAVTPTEEDLENQNTSGSTSVNDWSREEDWLMADAPRSSPPPKAKAKAKGAKRSEISGSYTAA